MFMKSKKVILKSFSPQSSYRLIYDEEVHSIAVLLGALPVLIFLFLAHTQPQFWSVFILQILYYMYLGLDLRRLLRISFYALSFAAVYLLMLLLFPAVQNAASAPPPFFSSKEFFVFLRLFMVSTISVASLHVINAEVVFLYLAQKKKMPAVAVYSLLFAVNSVTFLKKKFDLYVFNNRLRGVKGFVLPRLLFQFLVFVLRFSETGACSLVSRGISEKKYYYYDFSLSRRDKVVLALNFAIMSLVILIATMLIKVTINL